MFLDMKSNPSFVQYAEQLKHLGVDNWDFCLRTFDDSLEGVDPHDKNLTEEQKEAVLKECKNNAWYFIRTVVRIPVVGRTNPLTCVRATELFMSAMFTLLEGKDHYCFAPRQRGRSMLSDIYAMTLNVCEEENIAALTCHPRFNEQKDSRINELMGYIPEYIRGEQSYGWGVDITVKLEEDDDEPEKTVDKIKAKTTTRLDEIYNGNRISSVYVQNGSEEDIFKSLIDGNYAAAIMEDVQYHRAWWEVMDFIPKIRLQLRKQNKAKRFGDLYTIPMENEGRTKSEWHAILEISNHAKYWSKGLYDKEISSSATWRMEPITDRDVHNMLMMTSKKD